MLPPLTDDPDLHLLVDGVRVDAEGRDGQIYEFLLTDRPDSIYVISRGAVPAELGLARDSRSLGVALRRIVVRQALNSIFIEAADRRLVQGFHDYEPTDNLRWTDGSAMLPAYAFSQFKGCIEVTLYLAGETKYPLSDDIVTIAA
jgi:hypothetical protein